MKIIPKTNNISVIKENSLNTNSVVHHLCANMMDWPTKQNPVLELSVPPSIQEGDSMHDLIFITCLHIWYLVQKQLNS